MGAAACLALWLGGAWAHGLLLGVLVPPWDKLVHLLLFTAVALLVGAVLGVHRPRDLWRCFGLALLLGVMDEGLQAFDPSRSLDPDDLLANAVGALLGTALLALNWRWRRGRAVHDGESTFTHR